MNIEVIGGCLAAAVLILSQIVALLLWATNLTARVLVLERAIAPLGGVVILVAKLDTRMETMVSQLGELNSSIRWMRHPAEWPEGVPKL